MKLVFSFFCLFIFNVTNLLGQQEQRYVTAALYGEMGNQMTMIATALSLAWDLGAIPVFSDLNRDGANIPINYREIFFRLNAESPLWVHWENRPLTYVYTPIQPGYHTYLSPWGCDLRYFDHHRNDLVEIFRPRTNQVNDIATKYPQIVDEHTETVGIHIRLDASNTIPFCGFEYFKEAVKLFSQNALFVVGSNRIEWVKLNRDKLFGEGKNIIFLESNCHTMDFNILRMCKHNITSASTFSFWAAYLNTNPSKQVVAPSLWYNDCEYTRMGCPGNCKGQLYPENWIILEVPLTRWTPPDVNEYTSTSVNS